MILLIGLHLQLFSKLSFWGEIQRSLSERGSLGNFQRGTRTLTAECVGVSTLFAGLGAQS